MIRQRVSRFVTLSTAAAVALMLLGVGTASAAPPQWAMTVEKLPATVSPGADAGYRVTITNNGPSNISQLFLVSDQTAAPSFVGTPSQGSCNATGPLSCSFGALGDDQSVVVTVAYTTPGSGGSFGVIFQANTTGTTFSDSKRRSHGDLLEASPRVTSTTLNASQDFAGGFVIDEASFQNAQDVRRQNPQATTLETPESLIPVMIEDGITSGVACTVNACSGAFGQWSKLDVASGKLYGSPFKVTLLVWGGAVPGGTDTDDVFVLHTVDQGTATTVDDTTYVIDTPCSPSTGTPTNAECLTVTKIGNNFKIEVWLFQNGFIRGGV